jgi:hypothetical protein
MKKLTSWLILWAGINYVPNRFYFFNLQLKTKLN